MMSINNAKNIMSVTVVLILIFTAIFYSNKISAGQTETKDIVISSSIQKDTLDKIERALKRASIPYAISENTDKTYNLIMNNKYTAYTLITLKECDTGDRQPAPGKEPVLSDEILFDCNVIDTLIQDYCNKIKHYKESNDELDKTLFLRSKLALDYYISKQLISIEGISDATVLISYDDDFGFAMIINTSKKFNDENMQLLRQFLTNNVSGINVEHEKVYEDNIIVEGLLKWELPKHADEIIDIEYMLQKSSDTKAVTHSSVREKY